MSEFKIAPLERFQPSPIHDRPARDQSPKGGRSAARDGRDTQEESLGAQQKTCEQSGRDDEIQSEGAIDVLA